jgi:hypothetical protein
MKPARNHRDTQLRAKNKMLRNSGGATQDQQPFAILMSPHLLIVYGYRIPRLF